MSQDCATALQPGQQRKTLFSRQQWAKEQTDGDRHSTVDWRREGDRREGERQNREREEEMIEDFRSELPAK